MKLGFVSIVSGVLLPIAGFLILQGESQIFGYKLSTVIIVLLVITLLFGTLGFYRDDSKTSAKIGLGLFILVAIVLIAVFVKEFFDFRGSLRGLY